MKLLNLSVFIILLLLKNTIFGQTKNIKIYFNDKANTTLITFFDELLDYKREVVGIGRSNVYEFNSSYPTVIHLSKFAKNSPFLVFPGDSLVFERDNDSTYYRCVNRPDSLFHLLAKLEYTVGSEIAVHSGFQINDGNKSDFESLRLSVLEKLNKHLLELSQTKGDSLLSEAIKSELVNFSFIEFLQPLIANDNKNLIVPKQYIDSLISFKSKFIKNDTIVLGREHRKAIIAYNKFLCRDSLLLTNNPFQTLCNSAVRNFRGQQLYFLYAYLLKEFKVSNPDNFYDNVGLFYEICKDEYFIKYVKDKLDDRGFEYPNSIMKQEFIAENNTKTTWQEILNRHKGKLIYIDLWASWCRPCLEEMSSLKRVADDYKNKNISFISLSLDDKKKIWQNASIKHNVNFSSKEGYWIKKPKKFIQFMINRREDEFTPLWIPRCLLIDTNGNIITSKAIRPSHKELYNQLNLFLNN